MHRDAGLGCLGALVAALVVAAVALDTWPLMLLAGAVLVLALAAVILG